MYVKYIYQDVHVTFEDFESDRKRVRAAYMEEVPNGPAKAEVLTGFMETKLAEVGLRFANRYCNPLNYAATRCNTLQHNAPYFNYVGWGWSAICPQIQQYSTIRWNTLQLSWLWSLCAGSRRAYMRDIIHEYFIPLLYTTSFFRVDVCANLVCSVLQHVAVCCSMLQRICDVLQRLAGYGGWPCCQQGQGFMSHACD